MDVRESPAGLYARRKIVAMATNGDVYAQALLPTPRETSSSRNTRSECQTILAQLFTGPPRTGNDPIVLTRRRVVNFHFNFFSLSFGNDFIYIKIIYLYYIYYIYNIYIKNIYNLISKPIFLYVNFCLFRINSLESIL